MRKPTEVPAGAVRTDPGAYKVSAHGATGPTNGISSLQVDGVTVTTFDAYSGIATEGVNVAVTGADLSGAEAAASFVVTKNASSSGYEEGLVPRLTPIPMNMTPEEMRARLRSADVRLADLRNLRPSLAGADPALRLRLVQEFFFHVIGAVEVLAQLVNEHLRLGLSTDDAGIRKVFEHLKQRLPGHPLVRAMALVAQQTRNTAVPGDPYSEEGLVYRALISRHHVTHRHRNPFVFQLGSAPAASLLIDVRRPAEGNTSKLEAQGELRLMLDVITRSCEQAFSLLQ